MKPFNNRKNFHRDAQLPEKKPEAQRSCSCIVYNGWVELGFN